MKTSKLLSVSSPFGPLNKWGKIHKATISLPEQTHKRIDNLCPLCGTFTWIAQCAFAVVEKYLIDKYGHSYGLTPSDPTVTATTVINAVRRLTIGPIDEPKHGENDPRGNGGVHSDAPTPPNPDRTQSGNRPRRKGARSKGV